MIKIYEHKNEKKEETNTRKIKKIEDIRIKKENDFMKMEQREREENEKLST